MTDPTVTADLVWPRWLRIAVVAAATCILCSCRSSVLPAPGAGSGGLAGRCVATMPAPERGGGPDPAPGCEQPPGTGGAGCPAGGEVAGPWRPPGIAPPWPRDEYLCDGGVAGLSTAVRADGSMGPLALEDTIARFETADGRTLLEPSNRVCVYAPRFGAVRRVGSPLLHETRDRASTVKLPEQPGTQERRQLATTTLQQFQPLAGSGTRAGSVYRRRQQGGGLEGRVRLAEMNEALLPYEDFEVIRLGRWDQSEKARLAQAVAAAIVWTHDQAVQVILDGRRAATATSAAEVGIVYRVGAPGNPRLRVVKIASTSTARPGETVDFTIRYDNLGDQPIRTITLLDNLTTRLEFVSGSAKSSAKCAFSTTANEGGSLLLRWDFDVPLNPGEGGTVRFRCTVR